MNLKKEIPSVTTDLRSDIIELPDVIQNASGIRIFGKVIRSIVYSMDVAVIANCDADAVLAVYPWTPNTKILQAVSTAANIPVLAGIGGGLTRGLRSATVGFFAEESGAAAVVLNGPTNIDTIKEVRRVVDIPIIYTVTNKQEDLVERIDAGVKVFNVAGGKDTAKLVSWIRGLPDIGNKIPIIASGGKTKEQISETIKNGANAISYTAYGLTEKLFQEKMAKYRKDN
ncbi:hydrolase (plasmid) [Lactiplantibacillus plantarum]|uniref:hydrolase n=1 Tax=Lactiplantibacillus plantarum TaxID=1590 RepID=UPI00338DCC61